LAWQPSAGSAQIDCFGSAADTPHEKRCQEPFSE
jgi:hypothetical protein